MSSNPSHAPPPEVVDAIEGIRKALVEIESGWDHIDLHTKTNFTEVLDFSPAIAEVRTHLKTLSAYLDRKSTPDGGA